MVWNVNRDEVHPFFVQFCIFSGYPLLKHWIYILNIEKLAWDAIESLRPTMRQSGRISFCHHGSIAGLTRNSSHHIFIFIEFQCNANKTISASSSRCPMEWCINTKFNDEIKINWINFGEQCESCVYTSTTFVCLLSPLSNVHFLIVSLFSFSLEYYFAVGDRMYNVGGCAMIDKEKVMRNLNSAQCTSTNAEYIERQEQERSTFGCVVMRFLCKNIRSSALAMLPGWFRTWIQEIRRSSSCRANDIEMPHP